jgi:Ca2+-binding RTX toxin-like protein
MTAAPGGAPAGGVVAFSANQQTGAQLAQALMAEVANVTFTYTATGTADIEYGTVAFGGPPENFVAGLASIAWVITANTSYHTQVDVYLTNSHAITSDLTQGTGGFSVMLHELGHAVGLAHTFENKLPPSGTDSEQYSVMSYTAHPDMNASPSTFLLYDIAALQYLYGANMSTRTGNDTYSWSHDEADIMAIWDAGGTDTIDASSQTRRAIINLNDGEFSSIGSNGLGGNALNNIAIALNAQIENATGGSGNDTLTGNEFDNVLKGGSGADAMNGGAGSDTASYAGSGAVDVRLYANQGWNSDAQGDTLNSIENLIGSGSADILFGDANANIIRGGAGADVMNGLAGNDTVSYEDSVAAVDVRLTHGRGFAGDSAGDIIAQFENIIGGNAADILFGNGVDNIIRGGAGADIMNGFGGNDTVSYEGATAAVDVRLALGRGYSGDSAGDIIAQFENIIGGNAADILFGNGVDNIIRGGAGADIMNGFGGIDTVSYEGATAAVDVRLALGRGYSGDSAGDIIAEFENIIGGNAGDILFGNSVANIIRGGLGADIMNGFGGNDVFEFHTADFQSGVTDIVGTFEEAVGNTDILRLQGTAGEYTFLNYNSAVRIIHNATGGEILLGNFTVAQLDAAQVDYFV